MDKRYKIVISSHNIYKEIELSPEMKQLKVGTEKDCDVRLHKNLFFGNIELLFTKKDGEWSVQCSDNLYLTVGDIRKLMTKQLVNGDLLSVKYYDSDNTVFSMDFLVDFDDGNIRYERVIDTYYQPEIRIGCAPDNTIILSGNYVKNDSIVLTRKGENYVMKINNSSYGVLHNGKRAESGELIKDGDFISISDYFFCIKDGRVWAQIKDGMTVNSVRYTDRPAQNGYPKFNRSTRVKTVVNTDRIEILDPPAKPEKPKNNLLMRLLPSMGMLVAAIFMASKGGSMIIFSAISGVMSVLTAIMGVIEGKKEFKTKTAERIDTYNSYIERKRDDIEECREEELDGLNSIYISQPDEIANFDAFSTRLFDRRREDEDFLSVRLGTGAIESGRGVNYKKQEKLEIEDELQKLPGEICEEYKLIENAPIVCPLKDANAIGIVGEEPFRFDFLKNFVVDIAARQYSSDVKMVFVATPEHKDRVYWFRFLPQVFCEAINSRTIVINDESKNTVFEYLYKELTQRKQSKTLDHHTVVFIYDEYGFQNHPISKFVDCAGELGITFVFFGDKASDIPMGCTSIINIIDAQNAELIDAAGKRDTVEFEYPRISEQETQDIIDILAPVYTEELSLEGTLTKNYSMFDMLNIIAVDDIDLEKRWAGSAVSKSMAAPLGVSKSGTVYLDLHDKAHGPHGLVAGTTGSGKSEILQTYILAMSTLFHPYEVGFVIIDFKGGGMVNQFRTLPHLVGAITNIDGKEIDRSLKSIKAELQKRQRYFADADVNHIDKYITKYKKGEVDRPLPHLIIIVDEFAELKAEQPEFMKELISAARIGRSLGVHLILATQKPSGQVNEQIWSNSRFKLCLKVQSQEDSNEVLKSPLAAEIKEPGRAYLQVGNNEIFELFQSAYSGAPEKTDDSKVKEFTIYSLTDAAKRVPVFTQKKSGGSKDSATQLDAIVAYVARYCEKQNIVKLPDICLPALEKVIPFPAGVGDYGIDSLPIGIYDNPDEQYQGYAKLSIGGQNMLVVGAAASGKTNLIQVIIRMAVEKFSPREINFYIADFGSMYLKNYSELNHVGGVVTIAENEKFKNLFKLLLSEIAFRKEKFQKSGLSSFESYVESGKDDLPRIVFVMENFSAFKEVYGDQYEDSLLYVLREGITCGISLIITNQSSSGFGYKFLSNIPGRVALRCNEADEYSSLFDRCRMRPDDNAGRMLCAMNNEVYEAQSFLAFEGEKEYERSMKVKVYVAQMNEQYEGLYAKRIPCVPDKVTFGYIENNYNINSVVGVYPLGIRYNDVDVELLDTRKMNELCVVSNNNVKKQEIANKLIGILKYTYLENPSHVYIIDSIQRPLKSYSELPMVEQYTSDYSMLGNILDDLKDEIENRYDRLIDDDESGVPEFEQIVVIINNNDAIEYISNNNDLMQMYRDFTKKYAMTGICFWYTNLEDSKVSYNSPELLRSLKERNQLITDGNLANMKFCDISASVAKKNKMTNPGDVFLVTEDNVQRIKLVEEE